MRTMLTTLLLAGAMASTALADGDFQWQGTLAPGQLIQIRGLLGGIHAVGTSDSTATITATKTGNMSDPTAVQIQLVPFDGGVVVCAIYPDAGQEHPNQCNPPGKDVWLNKDGNNDVDVEFTVAVPPGVKFTAITLKGDIQATGLSGDVDASTLEGNITISTTGNAQASTLRGTITGATGRTNWGGIRSFIADNGSVDLQIPSDADVSVSASVIDGVLASDFPLRTVTAPGGGSSMATGTIGRGSRPLRIVAGHGNITLRQGPPAGQ